MNDIANVPNGWEIKELARDLFLNYKTITHPEGGISVIPYSFDELVENPNGGWIQRKDGTWATFSHYAAPDSYLNGKRYAWKDNAAFERSHAHMCMDEAEAFYDAAKQRGYV